MPGPAWGTRPEQCPTKHHPQRRYGPAAFPGGQDTVLRSLPPPVLPGQRPPARFPPSWVSPFLGHTDGQGVVLPQMHRRHMSLPRLYTPQTHGEILQDEVRKNEFPPSNRCLVPPQYQRQTVL